MTPTRKRAGRRRSLAIVTPLPCKPKGPGRYELTRKFIDGAQAYARAWDGPVVAYFDSAADDLSDLDRITVSRSELDFEIEISPFDTSLDDQLEGRGVVLGNHYRLPDLAQRCRLLDVASVYNPEYTLRTRLQFIHASRPNPLRQLRGAIWELAEETRLTRQIRFAHGLQCNGLPSYRAYAPFNRAPLLYFDGRIKAADLISAGELFAQNQRRARRDRLHLVFSGRLIPAKGADHLIDVALALRSLGVPFRMTICGDGMLKAGMEERIRAAGLGDVVEMAGVLDFADELVPFLKREADLFVCCHRQGDPSCSYLEALSCGVPIVGYANEALTGMVEMAGAGASSPLGRPRALARRIAQVARDRLELCTWAEQAREFAARHTMESTFEARVAHLLAVRDDFQRARRVPAPPRSGIAAQLAALTQLRPARKGAPTGAPGRDKC